MMKNRAVWICR